MNENQRPHFAIAAMGFATFLSRILGLVREIIFAGFLGQTFAASAFYYAFAIPNLFRRLLGEGALTAAFIPIFSKKINQEGKEAAARAASIVTTVLAVVCVGITLATIGLLEATKFFPIPDKWHHILSLTEMMFPYMIFVCLAALGMAILNVRGYFFVPSMSPLLLNVVMIGSVFVAQRFCGGDLERGVLVLTGGVLIGGAVQWLYQLPSLHREGFSFRWNFAPRDPVVLQVGLLMLPAVIGTTVYQINVLVSGTLAFWVSDNARAALNYADRLMQFPMGIFGVSVATVAFTRLAHAVAQNKMDEYKTTLVEQMQMNFFLTIPSAVGLIVLAEPIVRLLFQRGRFDAIATHDTAFALQYLAPGLIAYSSVNLLARAFYALHDTRTPMKISVNAMILNLPLTVLLMQPPLGIGGIALANTLSSTFNALALAYYLRKRIGPLESAKLARATLKIIIATAVMTLVALLTYQGLSGRFGEQTLGARIFVTGTSVLLAAAAYFAAAATLKVEEIKAIGSALRKRGDK